MNTLRWAPYPGSGITYYRIYRSMVGFAALLVSPELLEGLTLTLKMNGGAEQTVTFDGVSSAVSCINSALVNGRAYTSLENPQRFYVRSDIREAPGTVEILEGTALPVLGLSPRVIGEVSEDLFLATIPAPTDQSQLLTYQDQDGALQDFYALTTVDNLNNESNKTAYKQPVLATGDVCVIEGIVTNVQGVRLPDQEVRVTLVKYPQASPTGSQIALEPVTVLTGPDGRYSITLLQKAVVQIDIQAIGFNSTIEVPAKAFAFIAELGVDLDYRYPLNAIGVNS